MAESDRPAPSDPSLAPRGARRGVAPHCGSPRATAADDASGDGACHRLDATPSIGSLSGALLRLGVGLLALVACTTSAPARTALQGDLPALKAAIEKAEQQDQLGSSGVKDLAGAVLERELASPAAPGDVFPNVSACTRELRPVLEDVASGPSEFSAPAAVALIDAGYSAPSTFGVTAEVVAARQAVGARAGERRRALMLHGDSAVRRAALAAALDSAVAADVPALAEAARLDPDSEARALALRALGRIGGEDAVRALIDVYAVAPLEERREIVQALSTPASSSAGGATQLENLAQTSGEPAVLAALALAGRPESRGLASAALVRAIEGDTRETRLLALEAAPWSDVAVRAAIVAARQHRDAATRVLSLWRSAEAGELDAEGGKALEQLSADEVTNVGAVARAARARAGQDGVKAALRVDLTARAADRRTLAALALLRLEDWGGAARALGDDSPRVRRVVACQVLAGEAPAHGNAPLPRAAVASPAALVPLLITESAG